MVEHSDDLYVMNTDGTGYREQSVVARVQSGEHLDDIDMALQQSGQALSVYDLAKVAGGLLAELDQKQARAKQAGGKVTSVDGQEGAAEYKMLLANGRVERVEPAGDKMLTGGAEMLRHAGAADVSGGDPRPNWPAAAS